MSTESKNVVVRSLRRVLMALGAPPEQNTTPTNTPESLEVVNYASYSEVEMDALPGHKKESTRSADPNAAKDILDYVKKLSESNLETYEQLNSIHLMSPEILKAKTIFVSSIMSPSDMQTAAVSVNSECPQLDTDENAAISKLLSEFFNDKLKFGTKLTRWIGEALFDVGSRPVMILPKRNIELLRSYSELRPSMEGYQEFKTAQHVVSCESLAKTVTEDMFGEVVDIACEALMEDNDKLNISMESRKEFVKNSTTNVVKFFKDNSGNLSFSNNLYDIANDDTNSKARKELEDNVAKYFVGQPGRASIMSLSEEHTEEDGNPALIELPASAVVPVCVPGSKSEHIGYFVVVDGMGRPLKNISKKMTPYQQHNLTQKAVDATFGNNMRVFRDEMSEQKKFETASNVFAATVQQMMNAKLEGMNLVGMQVERHDAVTKCMFHHLLKKNQVKLIFVPEAFMAYYCFDNREDGTGKSCLEDVLFILGLRLSLIISKAMAQMKNAVHNKTIELDVTKYNTSIAQTLDLVRKVFRAKETPLFSTDPMTAVRGILDNSLTIIPKGIKGLEDGLTVSKDDTQRNVPVPDEDLIESLTKMAISGIGVPPAAVNELGENEYSRSVATSNLHFSNEVRTKQNILEPINGKIIAQFVRYSDYLRGEILKLISSKKDGSGKDEDQHQLLNAVINNLSVSLPSPNVSTDKAHHEELRSFLDLVNDLTEGIFPEELLGIDDSELKMVMNTIRATVRAELIQRFMESIGYSSSITVSSINDVSEETIQNNAMRLLTLKRGLDTAKELFTKESNSNPY